MTDRPAVLLLATPSSYRLAAFVRAASNLDLDVIRGIDTPGAPASRSPDTIHLDFTFPRAAVSKLVGLVRTRPNTTVLAIDDAAVEIAASVNHRLRRSHNLPGADVASRDKAVMRQRFHDADLPTPERRPLELDLDPARISAALPYPVVVKPTRLNGSRGVIRADDRAEFADAYERIRSMLADEGFAPGESAMLVEAFIPGFEVAVEGLMTNGSLTVLALFDKPDPLNGPYFEETIYVTPSRLPTGTQLAIAATTERMAGALGIRHGPVHAEMRINEDGVWPIEVAGRSIGGLCSKILEFGAGMPLEEIILRHAVGREIPSTERSDQAVGVMMIPIPGDGVLRGVDGIAEASAVPGITGIEITAPVNQPIQPLPEGSSYLGFIFARGSHPAEVESSLRNAHALLDIAISPMLRMAVV
ncbi:MAG TPA: ATP-grasp domain-containing protein [Thermomicrobiales bacterium]|nr:ATP-grasp domain-containing protein [Thermomicrobiales bacterium]